MLKVDEKILNSMRGKSTSLVVKTVSSSCGWGGGQVKSLWIEAIKNFDDKNLYNIYEYEDIKVYIHKSLKTNEEIYIFQKAKIPFIGPIFGSKGITIVHDL